MSERLQFGCACCSPHMLPAYQHDCDEWQALLAKLPPPEQPKAVIFHGGKIYPDPENPERLVDAIGIANGKVIAIGSHAFVQGEMTQYKPTERLLGAKETLLPGLIDPHAHLVSSALMTTWIDLSPFTGQNLNTDYDKAYIENLLRAAVEKAPAGGWVTGYGVDPSLMAVWEDIGAKYLDPISTKVNIFLLNASGHISYVNTAALKAAGLEKTYPDGILTEQQSQLMIKAMPFSTTDQIIAGLTKVFQHANERGITTLFDASVGMIVGTTEVSLLRALAQSSVMTVRVGGALYGNSNDLMTWVNCYKPELSSDGSSLFTLRAIKLIADGSNQGLTGLQSQPYQCCEEHSVPGVGAYGLFNYEPARKLAEVMAVVSEKGWPILTHANGDEGITNVLAAYQMALSKVPPPPAPARPFPTGPAWADQRHRIEHASLLHDDAIALMKRMAISPSFLIGHVGYWGKAFRDVILGGERALLLDRCASALQAGLRISLHSDHFVTPLGPLRYMEQAIGRVMEALPDERDEDKKVLNKDERLDVHQALRAVTIDAAWQCHLDHQIGSLLPGKQADLVILAKDPLHWDEPYGMGMRDIGVLETWVNGNKVFSLEQ